MKKLMAILLCACLVLTVFAGGGLSMAMAAEAEEPASAADAAEPAEEAAEAEEEPAEEGAAEADEEPAEEEAAEAEEEPAGIGLGGTGFETYPADTVVGTVNGSEVTWVEYYYWLNEFVSASQQVASLFGTAPDGWDAADLYMMYYMAAMYGYVTVDLTGLTDASTNAEVVTKLAQDNIIQYHAIESGIQDLGITLSEESAETLQSFMDQSADSTEGVGDGDGVASEEELAAFEEHLASEMNMTPEFLNFMNSVYLLQDDAYLALFGQNGEEYSDEDTQTFVDEYGLMAAKHILLLTVDTSTGEALSEDAIAEKLAIAEDLSEQLHAEEDPEAMQALFDELAEQYTEDTGYESFPDGYIFLSGEMVAEFENAVLGLDVDHGLSDVVESSYGYHIIMRLPVDPDGTMASYGATVRNVAASQAFYSLEQEWFEGADVQWEEGFESPDLAAIFG